MELKKKEGAVGTWTLDLKGLICPHPQLYTSKTMNKLPDGAILEVTVTNPSSVESVKEICKAKNYTVLSEESPESGVTVITIQK